MSARPRWLGGFSNEKLLTQIETSLAANLFYQLDREYVVKDGEITIVDESSGRMMEGRKWQRGLHQAVEVKEGIHRRIGWKKEEDWQLSWSSDCYRFGSRPSPRLSP